MSADSLELDFYGVGARLRCPDAGILADLRRDFAFFLAADRPPPGVVLEILPAAPPPRLGVRRAHWRWRSARIARRAGVRAIDYEGRGLLEYDFSGERGRLYSADRQLLHELAYLTVLSRVGRRLDSLRRHRVHALGFSYRGQGGLLLLPSGGGKSRLWLELSRRDGFRLLSDDIPLLAGDGSEISAFPLRVGLRPGDAGGIPERFVRLQQRRRFGPKFLVDTEYFQGRLAPRAPLRWILLGSPPAKRPAGLAPCSKLRAAAALAVHLVLGIGTPQVLELLAPPPPFLPESGRLARILGSRSLAALRAVSRARCALWRPSLDPRLSARALEDYLSCPCA